MATQVAGYILRAKDRHTTARFYQELGLNTKEHRHGGPKHYEMGTLTDACVMEVYQWSELFPHDALMLSVDSISNALGIAATYGIQPRTELREMPEMKFIYINDPDGRAIMLIEPNQCIT
mgnify:CR=1 FL=1